MEELNTEKFAKDNGKTDSERNRNRIVVLFTIQFQGKALQRFSIWPLFINGKIIMERKTE
jgi:hypothetical protein